MRNNLAAMHSKLVPVCSDLVLVRRMLVLLFSLLASPLSTLAVMRSYRGAIVQVGWRHSLSL